MELLQKRAWFHLLDIQTKGPADELCLRFARFFSTYDGPKTIRRADCAHILAREEPIFGRLRDDFCRFVEEVESGGETAFKPRDEYGKLWDLAKVSLLFS